MGQPVHVRKTGAMPPYLEREDVLQALRYAAWRAEDRELTLSGE
jgi:hypothetical protein